MKQDFKISYVSKDFSSIKNDLTKYAKRYYSDTIMDFSVSSPMSLLIDSIAYAADIVSYNIDYNSNETFLDTALEKKSILNIGLQNGFKTSGMSTISGVLTFYMLLPATNNGFQPDYRYSPTIRKGTQFNSSNGTPFILMEDIKITQDILGTNYTIAEVDPSTNNPLYYAVKFHGNVMSGKIIEKVYEIDDFTKFFKLKLPEQNILEIISIVDDEGNEYYEVESLSQDVVHKLIKNYENTDNASLMKPVYAQRRFTKELDDFNYTTLTFGGSNKKILDLKANFFEPSKVILDKFGRDYITDSYIQPNKLISGENFGIGPSNTNLYVKYRVGGNSSRSIPPNSLNSLTNLSYYIDNINLDINKINKIIGSIEVTNEETLINSGYDPNLNELKEQIGGYIQTQNRAVTDRDYESLLYNSPSNIGRIKRCRAIRDRNSLRNNLNIYIISSDANDKLIQTNYIVKQNIKNYLNNYRIMTDTIDILDAKVINIGINYEIMTDTNYDGLEVLQNTKEQLKYFYDTKLFIGEDFSINNIYKQLRYVPGLLDVIKIEIVNKTGVGYSNIEYDIKNNYTNDNRNIICPLNCIFEIKYADSDIQGTIR